MQSKLLFILLFHLGIANAQVEIKFNELHSKANLAYLKGELNLAYQNFNNALLINPSCKDCKEKCESIAKTLRNNKDEQNRKRALNGNIFSKNNEIQQTKKTTQYEKIINEVKPSLVFQIPNTIKIDLESAFSDSLLNTVYLSKHEVRQKDWQVYCNASGKKFPQIPANFFNPDFPIINISWAEAKAFAVWVSKKTGEIYDLPTLIEWQAAREQLKDLKSEAWLYNNAERSPHLVCTKNTFSSGLCDIEGNVSEWLEDWSDKALIEQSFLNNYYENNDNFKNRIVAGCSFRDEDYLCFKPFVRSFDSAIHKDFIGFRLVKRNF
ncbi:formylglycine-generating enzyme family protein [Arcticibacterium luteifluviistationis]|uniref:Sulfatase-modifying factor enzyme-like domain-containing protein n=1 Tax=Arcticibacterium luteifluviistationis TaxID=1784714 RepID=A0A2Z4G9E1_9BACT|nr:SUMF1/EgtB/PvdO family nonheme iron enzyme [Arcticibacterium luteifluviistationis]AWV97690.1 hypothetical protein DJ013_05725 [Arcticibacterium luteifluviistationis]